MPCVGLEPTIPASEQAKTLHALYRPATVTVIIQTLKMLTQNFHRHFYDVSIQHLKYLAIIFMTS
jgi:hypothetical protein